MKTMFIHGLDSKPVTEKIKILENFGLEVIAPHIDYRVEPNVFLMLKKIIINHNIEILIANSLGGYFGYWLSEDLGIPCILFNPALDVQDISKKIPLKTQKISPFTVAFVCSEDDIVPPQTTINFINKNLREDKLTILKEVENVGHVVDYFNFEINAKWALDMFHEKVKINN